MDLFRKHTFICVAGLIVPFSVFTIFAGYPVIYGLFISLTKWNGLSADIRFIGLRNYVELARDPTFITALISSLKWTVLTLIAILSLGSFLAIALFLRKVYFPSLFRALIFLPVTMSLVATGIMFSLILSPDFGLLDQTLKGLRLASFIRPWLGDYHVTLYILIAIGVWTYTGITLMLFHAGLNEMDSELLDAARLDGANDFQIAYHILLPSLKPVFVIVAVLSVIQSLRTFDLVATMTQGGPAGATKVLGYLMYIETFWNNRFGYGAAIAMVTLILSGGFVWIYLSRIARNVLHVSKQ
jgi:raffinose/stachyose/melibiose transport system permease protein